MPGIFWSFLKKRYKNLQNDRERGRDKDNSWKQNEWRSELHRGWQTEEEDPLQDAARDPWHAQNQQYQATYSDSNGGHLKGRPNAKGRGKGRGPKDDETKKKEVHFFNFPEIARERHMAFLFEIVERDGIKHMIEMENDRDGELIPVMYAFGGAYAKSSAIRFNSEADAMDALYTLRGRGRIRFTVPMVQKTKSGWCQDLTIDPLKRRQSNSN